MTQTIINLYEQFKNTPKKLKIVCNWDEVIQACEVYAEYLTYLEYDKEMSQKHKTRSKWVDFKTYFDGFRNLDKIEYSSYGSKLKDLSPNEQSQEKEKYKTRQIQIKNSPNFYQQAPFLTIAEDLLKLIKENKVEKLIFLSAYDKGKFPNSDERKGDIVRWTFFNLYVKNMIEKRKEDIDCSFKKCELELIPFENENQGQSKADWIKENAPDFDLVIDDNPNICKQILNDPKIIVESRRRCKECVAKKERDRVVPLFYCDNCLEIKIVAPYYPAIVEQHHSEVLLVKNEVSNLKIEDFD